MTRDDIAEINPDALLLEPADLDKAIVGMVERCGSSPVVLYSTPKLRRAFMRQGMTREEAQEWMDLNVLGAYLGEGTPMFTVEVRDAA